ncbi:Transposase DDE domain protein [Wolbachia endosymbiont of Armadillidium vulgare]|nr:Transposase DDE domain protein [Armadillidium vulgare] [Wolbachia endosymbiont of Armadillidium vulgare]OJH30344.1 Transposase DDE domain protein [Armadillidium vulgare] [Wolbachia endosymbiont of Armadillidium vulgare]OJH30597.1 Transposase DDE domain protein [Armadillidium vulgare] [Wolbachia endosymbiont of Armadillidium vulgare]OJH31301.1 Transposase DDE domain protein [Wolbachia endosymbiont of Armadillidium vulgare]OJH31784.1 Transposase DDE domain protein [Wolbachia endosymbiont of Ar
MSTAPIKVARQLRKLGLPDEMKFRLVKIILSSGEVEVLVTSLLDEQSFTVEEFERLYYLRWGVETFFSRLKGRLNLENFTGKSIETIKQDFWSTIFISNLESIMIEDDEETLSAQNSKLKKSINKSVSFNAIKNLAFDIFSTESDIDCIMDRLSQLFLMNTLVVRKGRRVDRHKISDIRSLNYQKRARKHVF